MGDASWLYRRPKGRGGWLRKALQKAMVINSKDHMSSIAFSMATLQLELGETEAAVKNLQDAKVSANKIADKDLKKEIDDLLETLTAD